MSLKLRGYDAESRTYGEIIDINVLDKEIAIKDSVGDIVEADMANVSIYKYLFSINGKDVYDNDVLIGSSGSLYLIKLIEGSRAKLSLLDSELKTVNSGREFSILEESDDFEENIEYIESVVDLHKSLCELVDEKRNKEQSLEQSLDFNIKIAKMDNEFYYVCNNKPHETVDLIKVIFVGSELFEEEEFERVTIPYEELEDTLSELSSDYGYHEVSVMELQSHVMDKMLNINYYEADTFGTDESDYDGENENNEEDDNVFTIGDTEVKFTVIEENDEDSEDDCVDNEEELVIDEEAVENILKMAKNLEKMIGRTLDNLSENEEVCGENCDCKDENHCKKEDTGKEDRSSLWE